jgi:hypothetical protein
METVSHEEFITILITLWAIWTARRKAIHELIFQSPVTVLGFVRNYISELGIVNAKQQNVTCGHNNSPSPRWIPPPESMKINVDGGAAKTQNKGAAAAVCRDADGRYMGSSVLVVEGITDPATLEAMACNEAVALAAILIRAASGLALMLRM